MPPLILSLLMGASSTCGISDYIWSHSPLFEERGWALQDGLAKLLLPKCLRGPQELPECWALSVLQHGRAMGLGTALPKHFAPQPCQERAGGSHLAQGEGWGMSRLAW